MPRFNTPAWKQLVMCQEVGHAFGLDHQDEDLYNEPLGFCMDYSADPEPNQHPNRHDYEQLAISYGHLDSTSTVGPLPADVANATFDNRSDSGNANWPHAMAQSFTCLCEHVVNNQRNSARVPKRKARSMIVLASRCGFKLTKSYS